MAERRSPEDHFEDTRMSFGDHLEELRVCLIRALIGIGIGCIVGFVLADRVVEFLQGPLRDAITEFNLDRAKRTYENRLGYFPPEMRASIEDDKLAPTTIYIDPGQLINVIRSISPDSLAGIQLEPYTFKEENVKHVGDYCKLLLDETLGEEEHATMIVELRTLLSDEQLQTVNDLAGKSMFESSDRQALVEVLDSLADNPEIHQSAEFEPFVTSPPWRFWHLIFPSKDNPLEKMKQVVDESDDADLSRRLNRILIAKSSNELISEPRIYLQPMEAWESVEIETQALSPQEAFMIWLKAGVITGLVFAGPWVFFQVWLFVGKGLYPHEQKYIYMYLPISVFLFVFGVCLAFFFVFQPVLGFLFTFNASMGITPQPRIGEWLSFVLFLPLGFGIAFQLPLVMLFLNRIGLFSIKAYLEKWRMAVLVIAILSMVLTPADPISMILLGTPLTFLYFFGIGLCKWMPRPTNPYGDVLE